MTLEHSEQAPPVLAARRRVPWRWILIALLALLLTAAAITLFWLRSYAPLGEGNTWWPGTNVARFVPAEDDPDNWLIERKTAVMDFEQDGQFRFLMSVANNGRLPVTLEGITTQEWSPDYAPIMQFNELKISADGSFISPDEPLVPFHPLTLDPGEIQQLLVYGTFKGSCTPPAVNNQAASTYDSVELRYSYARIFERTQRVPLGADLVLLCGLGADLDDG